MSTPIDLGRPVQGDVVDLILEDHRRFEALLRDLRDSTSDRDAVRQAFSALHVAHARAEEKHVYPKLRRKDAIGEHEAEHGEEEHAEGHEALLAVLELKGTDTQAFDDAVEELAKVVNHHLTEEELTILNPAREECREQVRAELGEAFAGERNAQLDAGCGSLTQVRAIVAAARREGLLDDDDGRRGLSPPWTSRRLQAHCLAKPGAWPDNPWGHEHPVIKVGPGEAGKIFAFLGADGVGREGRARPARRPTSGSRGSPATPR